MAKIRGNKYISVEERKSLDDISEIRNANVSLGTKLYDLTNQLASEIEGEPISESFPKSVHDLEDHSSLPGIPSITGLLDETAHDALDHSGRTGVPAAEAFTKDVHDLEDHSSLPGIPSVAGLLDETAHDLLDHAGLTGIPSVSGLLDETAHDLLDHAGLTGIPSVSGLLDETAHDLLDHTGLTGVGDHQWKEPVANESALPVNTETELLNKNYASASEGNIGASGAYLFTYVGPGLYRLYFKLNTEVDPTGIELSVYTKSETYPGTQTAISPVTAWTRNSNIVTMEINLSGLTVSTQYFFIIKGTSNLAIDYTGSVNEAIYTSDTTHPLTGWVNGLTCTYIYKVTSVTIQAYDGDVRYAKSENTVHVFDGENWIKQPSIAINQKASSEVSYPTVTEFNALLTKLKNAGIMASS